MAHIARVAKSAPVRKIAKPLLSVTSNEARRRVLNLYRAWYREVPHSLESHALDITVKQGRLKVREMFLRNKDVKDIRIIDMLVIKGTMDLEETHKMFKQKAHIMQHFDEPLNPQEKSFLSKFYDGYD
ncbi:NADH dehydrogenase [ubiquinone] 1 alpha subcomplex subunit 6-like [Hydractinia symbiolongicarpus]|uniref:NADH dehydrogenase [ubiquinone] 1 alpha subcomplex subunit 6-like n=1 Tax=Hydractinia symbiolongicarpus TaxID=13093 RepID=UPI00254C8866|nr:NADH dehydrogenase [ubiquinone] 1 alpha subcomplex subunit 6-like [Hydractinia symbiolongicarpus]